jgi:hypothetical protein
MLRIAQLSIFSAANPWFSTTGFSSSLHREQTCVDLLEHTKHLPCSLMLVEFPLLSLLIFFVGDRWADIPLLGSPIVLQSVGLISVYIPL